jgi:hypothetical protein
MPERDTDLTRLIVRDLDDIVLPARERWRPAPRKGSALMKASRFALAATAVVAALVLALLASFGLRDNNPVATTSTLSPTPTVTSTPTPSATSGPTATSGASAPASTSAGTGVITGELGYPSNFIPALRVYAISVSDERVHFFVDTPAYGAGGPGSATVPPGQRQPSYTITGVAPGTYYVLGYMTTTPSGSADRPGLYSNYVVRCLNPMATTPPQPTVASACSESKENHALVPVTVRAGETVTKIDVKDWYYLEATYPARPR